MNKQNTRIALITGSSRGLGRSMVAHLARQGVDSIITYRSNPAEAEAVAADVRAQCGRAVVLPLDVTDSQSFAAFAGQVKAALQAEWQRSDFDYLVNNAGDGMNKPFVDTTEVDLDTMYQTHLKGPYLLTQALLPMVKNGGRILNVSSGLTRFSHPGYSAYASMKGAVEVMTRYLAKELGTRQISVNTLAPGAIATDFGNGAVRDNPALNQFVASVTALGRVGMADDIGQVVATLLAEGNQWINAQRIEASGGMFV